MEAKGQDPNKKYIESRKFYIKSHQKGTIFIK